MGKPAVVVREDDLLTKAVDVMLMKELKHLPVVDGDGSLTGILSRLDEFETIMDRAPDWRRFDARGIQLEGVTLARDAMRKDTPILPPSAPVWEALQRMVEKGLKRIPVLDSQGRFQGMLTRDGLLRAGTII